MPNHAAARIPSKRHGRRWTRRHQHLRTTATAATIAFLTGTAGALTPQTAVAADRTITYQASSATIPNPERGLYRHQVDCDKNDFDIATLEGYRSTEKITLVMCIFYLEEFANGSAISDAQLGRLTRQAATVRSAGLKMILRFAYTKDENNPVDAALPHVQQHIDQLADFFRDNSDVIDVVQSGFIGAWGEGDKSLNFGSPPNQDWDKRKAVVEKLLTVVPASRMIQVRTPTMKRSMYGPGEVLPSQAYEDLPVARVGHHNDCFLASPNDAGTYQDTTVDYRYLSADTNYVAMGGETCAVNPPRSDCPTALKELALFHYSYLNKDYNPEVIRQWITQRCFVSVQQLLGYRFSLVSATLPPTAVRDGQMNVTLKIQNRGWAAPHNARPIYLVLRDSRTGSKIVKVRIPADPRRWTAGATTSVNAQLRLPRLIEAGTYAAFLELPDPHATLAKDPDYSIQLASTLDGTPLWEAKTGYNSLRMGVELR